MLNSRTRKAIIASRLKCDLHQHSKVTIIITAETVENSTHPQILLGNMLINVLAVHIYNDLFHIFKVKSDGVTGLPKI